MSEERARRIVDQVIRLVAPGVEPTSLDPSMPLNSQADLDTLDLGEMVALYSDAVRQSIPPEDYGQLSTIDGAVAYLAPKLPELPPA